MSLNLDVVGHTTEPRERSWTSQDVMLYALAVGAGHEDPIDELEFTTDNTSGAALSVLPTFVNLLGAPHLEDLQLGDFHPSAFVHAEQAFTLHKPIPPEGVARSETTVHGMYDKGRGALIVLDTHVFESGTGEALATTRGSLFVRGEGGFGGERGPTSDWELPARSPDETIVYRTRPEQALLYRLTGDRNPLHSDPAFAALGGFDRPILHGMCTYGYTGRAVLHSVCGSDPSRLVSMEARFTKPVLPGDKLTVSVWNDGATAYFTTATHGGTVMDRGRLSVAQ